MAHFLALPAELRNHIYSFVAEAELEGLVCINSASMKHLGGWPNKMTVPALLTACRQTRREYTEIFFGGDGIRIEEYHGVEYDFDPVETVQAKRWVFGNGSFGVVPSWRRTSMAGWNCRRLYADRQGDVRTGLMTVTAGSGTEKWQWMIPACKSNSDQPG